MSPEALLQGIILLPVLASLVIAAIGERSPNGREAVTLVAGLLVLMMVLALYGNLRADPAGVIEVVWLQWLPGLSIAFRLDTLGMLFALVAGVLWPVTSLYAIGYLRAHGEDNQTRFYVCFAIAIGAAMGVAFAANLLTLFVFYELLTLSTYPLVTHTGTDAARRGGRTYLLLLLGTSTVFLLLALIGTWAVAGTLTFTPGGVFPAETSNLMVGVLLLLFVFGIGKAALMPFHRWLPAAMVAPAPVSALLHAVAVVKAGVFSVLKVCLFIIGPERLQGLPAAQGLLYLAAATVLLASLVALRQDNLKARLAYSTVSQLAYITAGALLANRAAATGGAMHIATHAMGKITLFFCAGAIVVAAHRSEISDMRGLGRQMPVTMAAFFVASLSIIGLPPAGGTWSKWYLMLGSLDAGQGLLMAVLMLSSLLSIAYLLPIPLRAFQAGSDPGRTPIREAPVLSLLALSMTALACPRPCTSWPHRFGRWRVADMADEKVHLFDRPENVQRVLRLLYFCCAILLALDFFLHRHTSFFWERLPGFYPLYGFVGCVVLVLVAKWLRTLLMRPPDYYDRIELEAGDSKEPERHD